MAQEHVFILCDNRDAPIAKQLFDAINNMQLGVNVYVLDDKYLFLFEEKKLLWNRTAAVFFKEDSYYAALPYDQIRLVINLNMTKNESNCARVYGSLRAKNIASLNVPISINEFGECIGATAIDAIKNALSLAEIKQIPTYNQFQAKL